MDITLACTNNIVYNMPEIHDYIYKVIKNNNIKGNEKEVTTKIKLFITNIFHRDILTLKEFKYKEKGLNEYIDVNVWKDYVTESVIEIVIKKKEDKSLNGALQNAFDAFKYDLMDKITK